MASFFFSDDNVDPAAQPLHKRPILTSIRGGAADRPSAQPSSLEPTPSGLGQRRAGVAPPTLFFRSRPAWKNWLSNFWHWLWEMDDTQYYTPLTGLAKVKSEFCLAMWDLQSARANQVREMVDRARSLRELWHLRSDVFRVIAIHRGQIEAQQRLDGLDSHFPVRSSTRSERPAKVASW